jgi:hypothetical protein
LDKLTNLSGLSFGYKFSKPFGNLLERLVNLKTLSLDYNFSHPINIPSNIKYLILNCNNQSIVQNLPNSIEKLWFKSKFNLPLDDLPNGIISIGFCESSVFARELNCLPNSLEIIELPMKYDKKILNIPKNLKKIICSSDCKFANNFSSDITICIR